MGKSPWSSKTIIFFTLFAGTAVAGLFGYADWTPDTDMVEWVNIGVSAMGAWLRFVTREPIIIA